MRAERGKWNYVPVGLVNSEASCSESLSHAGLHEFLWSKKTWWRPVKVAVFTAHIFCLLVIQAQKAIATWTRAINCTNYFFYPPTTPCWFHLDFLWLGGIWLFLCWYYLRTNINLYLKYVTSVLFAGVSTRSRSWSGHLREVQTLIFYRGAFVIWRSSGWMHGFDTY